MILGKCVTPEFYAHCAFALVTTKQRRGIHPENVHGGGAGVFRGDENVKVGNGYKVLTKARPFGA